MGSIPLGALKMIKGGAEYLNPQATPGKVWQGVKDVTGGALQASTIPSAFVAPESGEVLENAGTNAAEMAKGAASATGKAASKAANAVRKPFSLKAVADTLANARDEVRAALNENLSGIQNDWHQAVRDTLNKVADEAGVKVKPAQSLNDVAANVSDAIKAKASSLQTVGSGNRRKHSLPDL
jgi:hypothetical protein